MKKVGLIAFLLALCLVLSGCNKFTSEISEYIVPPTPSGKLYDIQQALYSAVGTDITLRYPKSGDYRSAFVVRDIDGDAEEEALAFYSTLSSDNTTVMHVNLIVKKGETYVSVNDYSIECAGVNSVGFADISGDGNPETIITWLVPSSPNDKISVFYYDKNTFKKYIEEEYLTYAVCKLDSTAGNQLLVVSKDTEKSESYAKLFEISESAVLNTSVCFMDSDVQAYFKPIVSTLADGRNAVYIDATKGTEGTITELLFCDSDNNIVNPFVTDKSDKNTETLRTSRSLSKDVNGDEVYEIPSIKQLPEILNGEQNEPIYLTDWLDYTDEGFTRINCSLIDYSEGYSITMPSEWSDMITAQKGKDKGEKTVYLYDSLLKETTEEIFSVKLIETSVWEGSPEKYQGYFETARNDKYVLAVLVNKNSAFNLPADYFKDKAEFISQ